MLRARVIKRPGWFNGQYYAIAITYKQGEIVLQCPAHQYPCGTEDEYPDLMKGLNKTAKKFFESMAEVINNPERALYEKHMDEIDQANQQYGDK